MVEVTGLAVFRHPYQTTIPSIFRRVNNTTFDNHVTKQNSKNCHIKTVSKQINKTILYNCKI